MILARLSGLDEVRRGGIFKYVRMADGSFRFADVCGMPMHSHMVENDEHPVSAGTVHVAFNDERDLSMQTYGSTTLRIEQPLRDDLDVIATLLWGSPLPP